METAAQTVLVYIVNTYADGHTSTYKHRVPAPFNPANLTVLSDWWEGTVFPLTGDGYGEENDVEGSYEARVLEGPASMVGLTYEWA